ncbi:hypothetical protein ACNKHK_13415 [Shigella flexneri]
MAINDSNILIPDHVIANVLTNQWDGELGHRYWGWRAVPMTKAIPMNWNEKTSWWRTSPEPTVGS